MLTSHVGDSSQEERRGLEDRHNQNDNPLTQQKKTKPEEAHRSRREYGQENARHELEEGPFMQLNAVRLYWRLTRRGS